FVEHSALKTPEGDKAPASISEVLKSIAGKDSQTFRLEPRPHFDPEHSDAEAKREKVTVFYRVFRPDGGTFVFKPESGCEYLAIQYYFFCFFSDADFLANKRFEKSTGIDFPWSPREDRIAREHQAGPPVSDYELQNLGERDHPMPHDVARFVMTYAGKYGNYAPNVDKYAPVLKVLDIP